MRAALICFAALLAIPAQAAEANRCVVSVTPVQFGVYNPLLPGDMRTTGIVTYNCTESRPISISLTRGSASFYDRGMGQGLTALSYNLYLDAAGTMIWGDGSGGSQVYRDPAPPPDTNVSVPIYGRVPAHQRQVHVGMVDDSILVTINY
jgi:spore coat protein U-like protein